MDQVGGGRDKETSELVFEHNGVNDGYKYLLRTDRRLCLRRLRVWATARLVVAAAGRLPPMPPDDGAVVVGADYAKQRFQRTRFCPE